MADKELAQSKVINPVDVFKRLIQIDILRALPPESIQDLIPHLEFMTFPAGAVLIEQDAEADAMYFIEKGSALVLRHDARETWPVDAGSVVGEIAVLTGGRRP